MLMDLWYRNQVRLKGSDSLFNGAVFNCYIRFIISGYDYMFRNSYRSTRSTSARRSSSSRGSSFGKSSFGQSKGGPSYRPFSGRSRGAQSSPSSSRRSIGKSTLDIGSFINKASSKSVVAQFSPEHQFADFGLDKTLEKMVIAKGYAHPTPIQDKIILPIMSGKDVVGLANTGTGKTAAFLLPLIHKIKHGHAEQVLVLAPTRELALQINQEFKSFTPGMGIYSAVCVGGMNIQPQIRELRQHCHIVIGTPGRIIDLIKRGVLKLDGIKTIVLDEADAMLDMGFINDVRFVVSQMPKPRHTLFFSATMSPAIKRLIDEFLHQPIIVAVGSQNPPTNIEQDVVRLNGRPRFDVLCDLLQDPSLEKVLVFGRTKRGVEKLSKTLAASGIRAESIHGNKSHGGRQRSLRQFKEGAVRVLIATDVAARGLDISNVSHVINYELPESREDYIHRIGRTGRGVQLGKALTFIG